MDPNATLTKLRELVFELHSAADTDAHKADIADEMSDLVEALDNWLCVGGFLPKPWAERSGMKVKSA